jgi:prepilin-type N-terminal cleavage/methylation domain-containing protein
MQTMQIQHQTGTAGIPPAALQRGTRTAGISSTPIKALSASAGISPAHIKTRSATAGIPSAPRSAFTLVELLVVIGIIALLAAIVTPAVMRAQASARNAAIKAEIDMLHMAIMNYKNEYGSFPPCYVPAYTGSDLASRHILRLYPRTSNIAYELTGSPVLQPCNALMAWLGGYTPDAASPLKGSGGRQKLYDFDQSRVASTDNSSNTALLASRLVYFPSSKPGAPYIYINSSAYGTTNTDGTINTPATFNVPTVYVASANSTETYTPTPSTIQAEPQQLATGVFYFNRDTFQILCAGRDEIFGNEDDLSNFWSGTRKDYQDSLKQ